MQKLNYCVDCQRVFTVNEKCQYCNSNNLRELKRGTSVNIMGTKSKGKFLKYKEGKVSLIMVSEDKQKYIKDYDINLIKKIL